MPGRFSLRSLSRDGRRHRRCHTRAIDIPAAAIGQVVAAHVDGDAVEGGTTAGTRAGADGVRHTDTSAAIEGSTAAVIPEAAVDLELPAGGRLAVTGNWLPCKRGGAYLRWRDRTDARVLNADPTRSTAAAGPWRGAARSAVVVVETDAAALTRFTGKETADRSAALVGRINWIGRTVATPAWTGEQTHTVFTDSGEFVVRARATIDHSGAARRWRSWARRSGGPGHCRRVGRRIRRGIGRRVGRRIRRGIGRRVRWCIRGRVGWSLGWCVRRGVGRSFGWCIRRGVGWSFGWSARRSRSW